jgi:hypothetical protein
MVAVDYLSARRFPRFHTDQRAPIAPEIFTFTGRIGPAGDAIELITVDIFLSTIKRLVGYLAASDWVRMTV